MINNRKGSGLIELMIAITILSVALLALMPSYIYSSKATLKNNLKTNGSNLAIRQLERIKSLDYDDVGIVSGNPSGVINYSTTEVRNGVSYLLKTKITWVDDISDSLYPVDGDPRDYKKVEVTVSVPAYSSVKPQIFSTEITRQSNEQIATGGNIEVNVYDPDNSPIEDAEAQITTGPSSLTDLPQKLNTDENGKATFVMLPASETEGDYTLTAVKAGYALDPSMLNQTTTLQVGETRILLFTMAPAGNLNVTLVDDETGENINTQSKLTLNFPNADPVEYTEATGYFNIQDIYPGTYEVSAANDNYELLTRPDVQINPGSTTTLTLRLTPKIPGNLSLTVTDASTGQPIPNANVTISGIDFPGDINDLTNSAGVLDKQLIAQNYRLQVNKLNYVTNIQNFSITQSQTTSVSLALNQNIPTGATIRVLAYKRRNGNPRENVWIAITGPMNQSKQTDASGEALFENLDPGTYKVYRWRWGWRRIGKTTLANGDEKVFTVRY